MFWLTYSIILLLSHFLLLSFQCSPSWWEKKRQTQWLTSLSPSNRHTHTHKQREICLISSSVSGKFGSMAVWSCWGQTMARHPEEHPLCLCKATSCNLLLRDKTKLTWHFTADLTVLLDSVWQIWLKLLLGTRAAAYDHTKQTNGHYPSWWYLTYTDTDN